MLVLMVLGAVHQNLLQANQGHSQVFWMGGLLDQWGLGRSRTGGPGLVGVWGQYSLELKDLGEKGKKSGTL